MTDHSNLESRDTEYLSMGGFFNPEAMDHDMVRDLLIDCRAGIAALQKELNDIKDVKLNRMRLENGTLDIDALTTFGWPPEAVAAVERAALERAADVCDEMGAVEARNRGLNRGAQNYFRARNAILALAPSNSTWREVKGGWVVVPAEPTPAMTSDAIEADDKRTGGETCKHIYRAMLQASEKP